MSEIMQERKVFNGNAGRALELLGAGTSNQIVAATLGVSDSYISQLLSEDEFKEQVIALRYEHLSRHNSRDAKYDAMEDKLLESLEKTLGLLYDPMKILKAISVINAAKRRGEESPEAMAQNNTIVNLTLPNAVMQRFKVTQNSEGLIIEAGDQSLITATSTNLLKRMEHRQLVSKKDVQDVTHSDSLTAL